MNDSATWKVRNVSSSNLKEPLAVGSKIMTLAMHCVRNTHTVTRVRSHTTQGALRVARLGTSRTNVIVEGFRVRDGHMACWRWGGWLAQGRNEWIAHSTHGGTKVTAKQSRTRWNEANTVAQTRTRAKVRAECQFLCSELWGGNYAVFFSFV